MGLKISIIPVPSRGCTRAVLCILLAYASAQMCLFIHTYYVGNEPDTITLLKMLCMLIMFSSSSVSIVAVKKEMMFAIQSSEIMLLTAGFGILIYTIMFSSIFYRNWDWDSPNFKKSFSVFLFQRIIFGIFIPSYLILRKYRIKRTDMLDLNKWDIEDIFEIPLDENQEIKEPFSAFPNPKSQPPFIDPHTMKRPEINSHIKNFGGGGGFSGGGGVNIGGKGGNTNGKQEDKDKKDSKSKEEPKQERNIGALHPVGGNFLYGTWEENELGYTYKHPVPRPIIKRPFGGITGASPAFLPKTFFPLDPPAKKRRKPYRDPKIPVSSFAPPGYPLYPLPSPQYPHIPVFPKKQ
ncbi:uncharacterized protein LOC106667895 isoform X2 [Cimex lectularius]|uniref:Uncharacterized protein n=1 Tax=Cimex lectularius TaxID=79782 RepID=A0A8I6RWT3_CIMLE|nr:uncharacterized protein LOC106667895 isoform X2 [Cimex lectularius]